MRCMCNFLLRFCCQTFVIFNFPVESARKMAVCHRMLSVVCAGHPPVSSPPPLCKHKGLSVEDSQWEREKKKNNSCVGKRHDTFPQLGNSQSCDLWLGYVLITLLHWVLGGLQLYLCVQDCWVVVGYPMGPHHHKPRLGDKGVSVSKFSMSLILGTIHLLSTFGVHVVSGFTFLVHCIALL